jgi:hypothetical protein
MILVVNQDSTWAWRWPNAPKKKWGPMGWAWVHGAAIDYPLDPSPEEARATLRRVLSFAAHLPCGECRGHATEYIMKNPPNLSNTYAFQSWVWRFHNSVNLRLGKRAITYAEYVAFYSREIENAAWKSGKRPQT